MRRVAIIQVSSMDLYNSMETTDTRRIHADLTINFQEVDDAAFALIERGVQSCANEEGYILLEDKTPTLESFIKRGQKIVDQEAAFKNRIQKEEEKRRRLAARQRKARAAKTAERKRARLEKLARELETQGKDK